jgi:hypothetical protein
MTNDLADAIEITFERLDGNDQGGLKTVKFAGSTNDFAVIGSPGHEVALLESLITVLIEVSAEAVDFYGLCRRIREPTKLTPAAHIVQHRVSRVVRWGAESAWP